MSEFVLSGAMLAQQILSAWIVSPRLWGIALGAVGLWTILANNSERLRLAGKLLAAVGLVVLAMAMPRLSAEPGWQPWLDQLVYWLFAGAAVVCSAASITARNPVYTAIWFAGSLLGVAGLFLFQHAHFLGVVTVVVYAGAIVVTFLFVLMLASPEGHARYDRVSWSKAVVPCTLAAGVALLVFLAQSLATPPTPTNRPVNVLTQDHMVQVGTELFARHLVAVEVAGTLLLVALVGAVAIIGHGKRLPAEAQRAREVNGAGGASS